MDPTVISRRIRRWTLVHAIAMLACLPALLWWRAPWALAAVALASFLGYLASTRRFWRPLGLLGGHANAVTLGRLSGVLAVGFLGLHVPAYAVGLIAAIVVTLDGLDGHLARKHGTESDFGGHLDMETDALNLYVLASLALALGSLPAWILVIGTMRYSYVVIMAALRRGERVEPRRMSAKVAAVFVLYAMAAVFLLPWIVHYPAVIASSLLVLYSFGRSYHYHLFR
jgi:phosphatidylglycerophosphate synthase